MSTIVVTAAVIERQGEYLVTRRLKGTHLEDCWEFPGGKCEPGESLTDCLQRELMEELGVHSDVREEVFSITHDYGERRIELHFFLCTISGAPVARLGQEMRWVDGRRLRDLSFPPADAQLISLLAGPASEA